MGTQPDESEGSRKVAFPMVRLHCKELFDQLALKKKRTKTELDTFYGTLFGYAPPTIRAWRDGKAKPQTVEVIERLALDGMVEAEMSHKWLWDFLTAVEATPLYDSIVTKLPVKRDQQPTSRRFPIHSAWGALVDPLGHLHNAIRDVEIETGRPTVLFLGGASNMSEAELSRVERWIEEVFAPFWKEHAITIIDGATDAGIVAKLGAVYKRTNAAFPLVGVVTHSVVTWPGKARAKPTDEPLEPNHTQFLLTPGNRWEDASTWMARIGRAVAGDKRTVAVLVNGGSVAWKDVMCCLQSGIPVITIKGSGRTADDLAETAHLGGEHSLIAAGGVTVVEMTRPDDLGNVLASLLA